MDHSFKPLPVLDKKTQQGFLRNKSVHLWEIETEPRGDLLGRRGQALQAEDGLFGQREIRRIRELLEVEDEVSEAEFLKSIPKGNDLIEGEGSKLRSSLA
ncbi:hypothetical protein F3Y22_tig00110294pilonHSYRG00049 [Hibiscus syriacus]|uniref:Uncharacterized protein n=1 Tax=Hibiscus syriacus TaxID=106335 RepID=A0A6A3B7Y9_HIBSY|nr:hypothetical protein F3Y22_tig00110294pilonHSYRG00049 [Hibiscus syriacus]